jgi:two-component sensor histidine kinase
VTGDTFAELMIRALRGKPLSFFWGQLFAVGCVGLATLFRLGVAMLMQADMRFLAYFPALLAAALWGGMRAGATAMALSLIMSRILFIPREAPLVTELAGLGFFLVVGVLLVTVGSLLAGTVRRLAAAEERLRILVDELAHRARNGLNMMLALTSQSARGVTTVEAYEQALRSRLQAMGRSQELATAKGGHPPNLGELIVYVLEPFDVARFAFPSAKEAAAVPLSTALSMSLSLVLHELGTNATKYGALCSGEGKIEVAVASDERQVEIVWRETAGPPIEGTNPPGFGSRLFQLALRGQGGAVDTRFEPQGLVAVITFPRPYGSEELVA